MIAVQDLVLTYRGMGRPTISGLTAEFPSGAISAITGPSGSGKSTLLYVLGLMLTPTSGRITIGAESDAAALPDGERSIIRAERIGFVFQDAALDPARTILDNVLEGAVYAGHARRDLRHRAEKLLAELGVSHRADHRPGQISGGQAQRVALCRALIKQPSIILADEPTGNLDVESAAVVWNALADQAARSVTVVVATHDRLRAATLDRHIDLAAG